jgi:beta-mannanase
MLSFSHEPEADIGSEGSATDFVAAYRRVHDVAVAAGATNVVWVWDVEGIATRHWESIYRSLWPGAAYVEWIAWDPYNFASCKARPWRSFRQLVSPFYAFLARSPFQHRPLMLAEFGTVGGQSGSHSKQSWYAGVRSSLASFPRIKAAVYFDYPSPPASCNWSSSSSPTSAAAFARLANDPIFLPQSAVLFQTRASPDSSP